MIKVLHINAGSGIFGGVSAFCLNIYRNIDRKKVQFDFLTPNKTTYGQYREEIENYDGAIYEFGIDVKTIVGKVKFTNRLIKFLRSNKYDIIHINSGVLSFNCIVASVCKKHTNAKIFVHSHNNGGRTKVKDFFSGPLKYYTINNANCLLACSKSAAFYMFPATSFNNITIIDNGINTEAFKYIPTVRAQVRNELQLNEKFVIGNVGRFTPQKNHEFLIELFCKIKEKKKNAVLMLVGEGPLMLHIQEMAKEKNISKSVLFLGAKKNVNELYQAMDVFVLPSLWEGFGIVNIEAQTAGLRCVVSDVVPEEVNLTGNVIRHNLNDPMGLWVEEILNTSIERRDYSEIIKEKGFDIKASADKLVLLYEEALKE